MRNQIDQSNAIKNKFSVYLKSTFDIRDEEYKNLYKSRLEELESRLYKGPYLASALPFEQSKTINELVADKVLCTDFLKLGGQIDFNMPCYLHQVKTFDRIMSGNNVVVTTGTGSGKTECFMFPIINELIRELHQGTLEPGVRAIFLFPLNALVNNQIKRLREYLENLPDIRFGFYTGETPENTKKKEYKEYIGRYGEPAKNEILTREEMRSNPPQILFTNYAMLEYLLIRPTEQSLMSEDALKHLKYIVLDEAHTYRGAQGIEISLLLRRLQGAAKHKPQFVLTSATLGRGEEDTSKIIDFAEKLTSCSFSEKDIIFGKRVEYKYTQEYAINPDDYTSLLQNINTDEFVTVYERYRVYDNAVSRNVNIFNLLAHDINTAELLRLTIHVASFFDVLRSLKQFNQDNLCALIELIAKSKKDDSKFALRLYDIKYHMFMKAPDGAFVTIGEHKNLSLITTNYIDGYKAFKIGICQNCKVPYIMGITEDYILHIDDEIDIDESYSDKNKRLEYYLIADCLSDAEREDLDNNPDFEKYFVCSKCGYIKKATSAIIAGDCDHFSEAKTLLYKFTGKDDDYETDDDDVVTNNLHHCPICDYKSHSAGVIMGFHVGKDRATTLIAQILYESMEYPIKKERYETLFGVQEEEIKQKKQFLAFSDSRQQAAFFSKFLNSNNDRFLKKSMMWDLLKRNDHNAISYNSLVAQLEAYFKDLGYDDENAIKHAKATALWELFLVDGRNSGEGLGLFAFKLNLLQGNFANDALLEQGLKNQGFDNITAEQFRDLMAQVFTQFRTSPSIKYEHLTTDDFEERKELLGYRQRDVYISLKEPKDRDEERKKYVKSFLPVEDDDSKKSAVNKVVLYVKKALGYNTLQAKKLLTLIFNSAIKENILIRNQNPAFPNTYLLQATDYKLYSYEKLKFFKCKKCNKLTLYNINNKCVEAECDGELEECDVEQDAFYVNNYYRNEYINRPIENLICREHTAQMNSHEARKIEHDFAERNINFISCSTTFEMGIDLGGLNTVFMRNVPPTPSNYAQRAGRAGRRSETSAFILTFCGASSHDYTYFDDPREMIRGLVSPPYFVVDNDKIIMRHLTATALSFFFRDARYQDCYTSIDKFIENDVAGSFLEYCRSFPESLGFTIDNYVLKDKDLLERYGNFKWVHNIGMTESTLKYMCENVKELIALYEESRNKAAEQRQWNLGAESDAALRRLKEGNSLITYLAEYNVIPRYGFPVDTVELRIYDPRTQSMNEQYNLSRNLSLALSEYAPGSEIIVNERKYTSRYLYLPYNGYSLPTTYYYECPNCHSINTAPTMDYFAEHSNCKYCNTPLDRNRSKINRFITPIRGFVTDRNNKNTKRVKPFKTYASDTYYIGSNLSESTNNNDVCEIFDRQNEELLILNESRFYYCQSCGYTELDKGCRFDYKIKTPHYEYQGKPCTAHNGHLDLIHLGYSYRTDIVQIRLNNIEELKDLDTAISVLFAILEGVSMAYNIERRDIGGLVYSTTTNKPYDLILFDTVPGGAGHVKRLKEKGSLLTVLNSALKKVSQDCCTDDTSCYNCLRTYDNQRLHKHIKKGLAKTAISIVLSKMKEISKNYRLTTPSLDSTSLEAGFVINSLYEDATSREIVIALWEELHRQNAPYPNGYGYRITNNNEHIGQVDFAWEDKNILLFSLFNLDTYELLKNTPSKYESYLLSESFNYIDFVKELCK